MLKIQRNGQTCFSIGQYLWTHHKNAAVPPVKITFPNGDWIISTDKQKDQLLSNSFNRNVHLSTPSLNDVQFEGYIPEESRNWTTRAPFSHELHLTARSLTLIWFILLQPLPLIT